MQPVSADEIPDFLAAVHHAFHGQVRPEDVAVVGAVLEPERTLAVRDGDRIVATTGVYSRRLTVPGGELPMAGVTQVGVLPSHRRRGLLTGLMRRQLNDVREAGEAVAALWASETAIYGRFGYGMATRAAELDVSTLEARLRRPPELGAELREPGEAKPAMAAIHDAARRDRPGMLDRPGAWWEFRMADPEHRRDGMSPLKAAVVDGEA
ncbi:MAG: GNAT family N-acetyltransferase, partial [Solirubrobacteraceae bacterium]